MATFPKSPEQGNEDMRILLIAFILVVLTYLFGGLIK